MNTINPVSLVNGLVEDLSFANIPVPYVAKVALQVVKIRHYVWWFDSKKKLVQNTDNWLSLGVGFALNLSVQNEVIRTAAKILNIAIRIEKCASEIKKFCQECINFWDIFSGRYSAPVNIKWIDTKGNNIFTPTFIKEFNIFKESFLNWVQQVAQAALRILRRFDRLLMRSIDAYESFYANQEAMNEVVYNGAKLLDQFFNKKAEIYTDLEKRKPLIEKSLRFLGVENAQKKTDDMLVVVKETIDQGEDIFRKCESVSEAVGVVGLDLLKRSIFGPLNAFKLGFLIPDALVCPPIEVVKDQIRDRRYVEVFPSVSLVSSKKKPVQVKS